MGTLWMIRHGQASFMAEDYDNLSPTGVEQSQWLGNHWGKNQQSFTQVYTGSCRRHHQTYEAAHQAYKENSQGKEWPKIIELPEFAEYRADILVPLALPQLLEKEPEWEEILEKHKDSRKELYSRLFRHISMLWIQEEIEVPEVGCWKDFKERIRSGLQKILNAAKHKEKVVVFTSGGPIALCVGFALDLSDQKILELSWRIQNSSVTEFMFAEDRFTLNRYNTIPHVDNADQLTMI